MNRWAISDIHGCVRTFRALLQKINFTKKDELYLLGDYIDRGPDSKGVIDHIWQLREDGFTVRCLRGNHEQLAIDAKTDRNDERMWLANGGPQTLISFRASNINAIPKPYLNFLENLPHYFEVENYILVHAGLNFDMPNPLDGLTSMMWIRRWYEDINYHWLDNRIIVHGHTPQKKQIIEHQHKKLEKRGVLDIDCGCVFDISNMGYLCAFNLTDQELVFQVNIDKSWSNN